MSTQGILTGGGFVKLPCNMPKQSSEKIRLYYLPDLKEERISRAKDALLKELTKQYTYQGKLEVFATEVHEKPYLLKEGKILHLLKGNPSTTAEGITHNLFDVSQTVYRFLSNVTIGGSINVHSTHANVIIHMGQPTDKASPSSEEELLLSLKKFYQAENSLKLLLSGNELALESIYTSLALITEKESRSKLEEIRTGNRDGRIPTYESIFLPKEPIVLEEIFHHPQIRFSSKKRIVIQGSAGVGKSTLCRYVSYNWARGKLWPEFKAIFWIKFRNLTEKRYPNSPTVAEVIASECGLDLTTLNTFFSKQDFKEQCLLILDGYDELANPYLPMRYAHRSLPALEAFQKEFPHLLLTTRPQEMRGVEKTLELEILGFDREGITRYVDHFFSEEKKEAKKIIRSYLKDPLAYSLCHIPINLEIFCSLAYQGKALPLGSSFTITSIYTILTEWLIERFGIERLSVLSLRRATDGQTLSRKDFIERILEQVAWEMIQENNLYISLEQIQHLISSYASLHSHDTQIQIEQIGPFRIDNIDDIHIEGHFIHLTFQEFFAAKHLARHFREGKSEKANKILAKKKFDPRYRIILWMTAGLLSERKELLQTFFDTLYAEPRDLAQTAHK